MCVADYAFEELLSRARADYLTMPGLHLSAAQAARLWSLDSVVCEAVLGCLVASGFLRITHVGRYAMAVVDGVVRPKFRPEATTPSPELHGVQGAGEEERRGQW